MKKEQRKRGRRRATEKLVQNILQILCQLMKEALNYKGRKSLLFQKPQYIHYRKFFFVKCRLFWNYFLKPCIQIFYISISISISIYISYLSTEKSQSLFFMLHNLIPEKPWLYQFLFVGNCEYSSIYYLWEWETFY